MSIAKRCAVFFHKDWHEDVWLRDGRSVHLRLVRPEDKAMLADGLAHLSKTSRYRRFFTAKSRLSPRELKFLTEVDGVNHFAIGALLWENNAWSGVGIGRFIRLSDRPDTAEPAIVVVDAMQGLGLGKLILSRLVAAARERGIARFHCEVLAENEPVKALLAGIDDHPEVSYSGTEEIIEITLPSHAVEDGLPTGPLGALLTAFAAGELLVKRTLAPLLDRLHLHDEDDSDP